MAVAVAMGEDRNGLNLRRPRKSLRLSPSGAKISFMFPLKEVPDAAAIKYGIRYLLLARFLVYFSKQALEVVVATDYPASFIFGQRGLFGMLGGNLQIAAQQWCVTSSFTLLGRLGPPGAIKRSPEAIRILLGENAGRFTRPLRYRAHQRGMRLYSQVLTNAWVDTGGLCGRRLDLRALAMQSGYMFAVGARPSRKSRHVNRGTVVADFFQFRE